MTPCNCRGGFSISQTRILLQYFIFFKSIRWRLMQRVKRALDDKLFVCQPCPNRDKPDILIISQTCSMGFDAILTYGVLLIALYVDTEPRVSVTGRNSHAFLKDQGMYLQLSCACDMFCIPLISQVLQP